MVEEDLVFISYAREDQVWAERLYMDLRKHEINAWLDSKCLKVGANWKHEIPKVIRRARFFLLLVSSHSISKRGYVQKEIKEGLEVLEECPTDQVFIIPVRLDETLPVNKELQRLNWVNLLPNYRNGFERILSVFGELQKSPIILAVAGKSPTMEAEALHKGKTIVVEEPLMVGERAAISYAPFRTQREFLQQFFDRLPTENIYADKSLSYYITLSTQHPGVHLGEDLLLKYPESITIVLHRVFEDLMVRDHGVTVTVSFDGERRMIAIPFDAVTTIAIPEIGIAILVDH